LDISGEPGFLIKEVSPICDRAVVTGYSQEVVDRMKNTLKIDAVRYDFNKDDIGEVVNCKFDVVLIRHAINFCKDVKKFLPVLKNVLNRDAIIYVSFVVPTLATCLRWQFDDYTYHVLYTPETIGEFFHQEGFTTLMKYQYQKRSHYLAGKQKVAAPIMIPYRLLNSLKKVNQEEKTKSYVMVFKN
jgi:2-polyprenyl-3-methyl-5-hydroxy-6-metoxy-1,4-benzoquinol methylase